MKCLLSAEEDGDSENNYFKSAINLKAISFYIYKISTVLNCKLTEINVKFFILRSFI